MLRARVMRFKQRLIKRTVRAHTLEGATFEGVLVAHDNRCVVLAAAKRLDDDGSEVSIAGNVHLPIGRVAFMQTGW